MPPLLFQIQSAVSFFSTPWVKFLAGTISISDHSQTVKCPLVIFRSKHSNYIVQTQVIIAELHSFAHFKTFPQSSGLF